jgi:hypothetical protein
MKNYKQWNASNPRPNNDNVVDKKSVDTRKLVSRD